MIEVITRTHPVPVYIAIPLRVSFFVGVHFLFGIFTFSTAFRMVLIFKVYVTSISSNTFFQILSLWIVIPGHKR